MQYIVPIKPVFIIDYSKIVINEYIQCVPDLWLLSVMVYVTTSCERDYPPIRWLSSIIPLKTASTTSPLPFVFYNQRSVTIYLSAWFLRLFVWFFFRTFFKEIPNFNRLVVNMCLLTFPNVCIKTERWKVWSDIPFRCLTFPILETIKNPLMRYPNKTC